LESVTGYYYPQSERWARLSHAVFLQKGFSDHVDTDPVPRGSSLVALRAFNTRYYVTAAGAGAPSPGMRAVYRGADAIVWLDPKALPRAYVVGSTRPADGLAALRELARGHLDPRRTALVPHGASPASTIGEVSRFRPAPAREVTRDRDRVEVTVPRGRAGWLVLANGYTNEWRAKVDGRPVTVRPSNYAAMGVPVSAGAHSVVFYVDHGNIRTGTVLFALTAVILVLAVLIERRRRAGRGWFGRL
jgi:hypothetical protein